MAVGFTATPTGPALVTQSRPCFGWLSFDRRGAVCEAIHEHSGGKWGKVGKVSLWSLSAGPGSSHEDVAKQEIMLKVLFV